MLVSCCLTVLIDHGTPISSVVDCHKGCWIHVSYFVRVQKDIRGMLLLNETVMGIGIWDELGFFTGSTKVLPSSVDLSDTFRIFSVQSKTAIKFNKGHINLLINEMHHVIDGNCLLEVMSTI